MLRFRSHSEHSLDPKGRLNIPSRFRDVLREQYNSEDLIVTHWDGCLRVYPVVEWEEVEEKLLTPGNGSPDFDRFVRWLIAGVNECPVDKQGRILLPAKLREYAGLKKDVVVIGVSNRAEIWDAKRWAAMEEEELDPLAKLDRTDWRKEFLGE